MRRCLSLGSNGGPLIIRTQSEMTVIECERA